MEWGEVIRVTLFLGTGLGLALWEKAVPRRKGLPDRGWRWSSNLGMVVISAILVRFIFPVLPVALAFIVIKNGWGLIPLLGLPFWWEVVLGFVLLDLAIYFQHRAFHFWRPLWLLHRMHHADTFYDFTTGVRFHPLEFILSMIFKLILVVVFGIQPLAVLCFEVVLNCLAMFNHGNIRLPQRVDEFVRLFVVTPDMHRVHHSTDMREMNQNFGFNLPWWDRIFATYKAQPDLGHEKMVIGLNIFRDKKYRSLHLMLAMPFLKTGVGKLKVEKPK
ncbi:Sterol desaturase/sphingolipid hydroxylase, fatty acid hydroxylase superfamily [Maridesulfovibrio ferrireducens]|uniref:Sterol desaturase/sphingolipid hydroxylase, fatty acid hydroxylase superfamily n=1 Tax=Maridesulfovibrio ferrireducens TaxID=246191 RepID=A0A1G9F3Z1_9BACT|nr:sterol desaturase family protein [Maridesulfovibrio ferrireducens]SDK83106.1 Sterol desaturase/sphingolipid hydroxylase, fatty acid hydroxylase superfamily [Maridesulfovibrio ferrireducens]